MEKYLPVLYEAELVNAMQQMNLLLYKQVALREQRLDAMLELEVDGERTRQAPQLLHTTMIHRPAGQCYTATCQ